ncbi:MAG: choice-of-anchor Q domain-containing protein [Chthoniobacterales bacterium]
MRKLVLLIAAFVGATSALAYSPPIGIPAPSFGIDQVVTMYSGQTYTFTDGRGTIVYPDAGDGPYTHYVDKNAVGATDTSNTYGTPATPRLTIPTTLTAGSVIEVHGGTYAPGRLLSVTGTASNPVFIRGISHDEQGDTGHNPFVWDNLWQMANVSYLIIENGKSVTTAFTDGDQTGNIGVRQQQLAIYSPSDHFAIRNCEFTNHGDITTVVRAGSNLSLGFGESTWVTGQETRDVVVYHNWIHDNISAPDLENGIQGMIWNKGVTNGWALENNIYNQGEDGIHVLGIPGRGDAFATNIYIGRNLIHDCSENALDVKQCFYTVVSENEFYNFHNFVVPTGGSDGAAIVLNDDGVIADNGPAWVINNVIHDSGVGVRTQKPADIYFVGNVFYDIAHDATTPRQTSLGSAIGAAIWCANGLSYHLINNTVFRCDGGLYLDTFNNPDPTHDSAVGTIYNNIVIDVRGEPTLTDLNPSTSYHIGVSNPLTDPANGKKYYSFDVQNNLLYQSLGTVYTKGTFTNVNGVLTDPLLVDKTALNFGLQATSPAIDAGTVSDVYATFASLYGLSIAKDGAQTDRPQNSVWDIGAYEYDAGGTPTPTPTATPTPTPLINQGFAGPGYDNGETWTPSGKGTIDPDSTSSPIVGGQSLEINLSAKTGKTFASFAAQDNVYGFCRIRWHSHTNSPAIISFRNSAGFVRGTVSILNATNAMRGAASSGTNADSSTGMPVNTNIYVWFEYQKGTGSNAIFRCGWSTTGTKPDLSATGAQTCNSSNGMGKDQISRIYLGTGSPVTSDVFYDHILVSTAPIGNNP